MNEFQLLNIIVFGLVAGFIAFRLYTVLGRRTGHEPGRVAEPLLVTGTSPDGVIEALELKPERSGWLPYLLAVQFHPERLFDRYGNFLEMFRGFIQACEARMDPAP